MTYPRTWLLPALLASLAVHVTSALLLVWTGAWTPRQSSHPPPARFERSPRAGDAGVPNPSLPSRRMVAAQAAAATLAARTSAASGWLPMKAVGAFRDRARQLKSPASGILTHLVESTIFALMVGLMTLLFRKQRARVRYWLWFSASLKFLIPFAMLVSIGTELSWLRPARASAVEDSASIVEIGTAFVASDSSRPPIDRSEARWNSRLVLVIGWGYGAAFVAARRIRTWRRIRAVVRVSGPVQVPGGSETLPYNADVTALRTTPIRVAPGLLEPGVVGFIRPIILLPAGIEQRLSRPQLERVLAHEASHVRHRDNLTAAMHMVVEALFWFHPLVWMIGARLLASRESACDQDVLATFDNPRAYADGIIGVCKHYVDARLACVSGVSSSDLKQRIEAIMRNDTGRPVTPARRIALGMIATLAIAAPVVVGVVTAPPVLAQTAATGTSSIAFEAASVKPNLSRDPRMRLQPQPGGRLTATNVPLAVLIRFAFDVPDFKVFGEPVWVGSERFDVVATAGFDASLDQRRLMVRQLLGERFKLTTHMETRELPIYALIPSRDDGTLGSQLRRSTVDCAHADQPSSDIGVTHPDGPPRCGFFGFAPGSDIPSGKGGLAFRGMTMAAFAQVLMPMVQRTVTDETGLTGFYDGDFDFLIELPPPPPPPGVPNPFTTPFVSVFTVLPEQLGLKLHSRRGPVEVLIIDGASRPIPD